MADKEIPAVTVSRWDGCLLPRDGIKASLPYPAHKTGKASGPASSADTLRPAKQHAGPSPSS